MSAESQDLKHLESALLALVPTSSRVDRDALMYKAGRASISPRISVIAACVFGCLSAGLVGWLAVRPPHIVERTVVVTQIVPAPRTDYRGTSDASDSESRSGVSMSDTDPGPLRNPLLEMRRQLLTRGDIRLPLPATAASGAPPQPSLEEELNLPPGSLERIEPRRRPSSYFPG
jgi:hypothetical protein